MNETERSTETSTGTSTGTSTEEENTWTSYEIRIRGHLDERWSDWFGGLTLTQEEDGTTLLTGPVVDQAALYGLLRRVNDTGASLLSVNPVESDK